MVEDGARDVTLSPASGSLEMEVTTSSKAEALAVGRTSPDGAAEAGHYVRISSSLRVRAFVLEFFRVLSSLRARRAIVLTFLVGFVFFQ
jgi:hypothetical protein